ncbi:MAG: carboxy terminal-processing peptidase [Saprospiraceae bacterium]|nr:carboxy terminal-processing peptidase [Saprospiraceae bacterium]
MKLRGPIFFSVLLITLLVAAFYPRVDSEQKDALLMLSVLKVMGQLHYQPQQLDDNFSQKVFDLYLDRIDSDRRFLTQKDIKQLEKYKTLLDDEAMAGNFDFFNTSLDLLTKGIEKTQGYYREILAQPFDLNKDESIELDSDKRDFAKNDADLKEYWRRYLKYDVINRVTDALEAQKQAGEQGEQKSVEQLEKEARTKVKEAYDSGFERLIKTKRNRRLSAYLDAVTNIFDPHSGYFEPYDKQNFDLSVNGRLEGIGARLGQAGDYVKIASIVVGGPAWKTKELQENDLVIKVTQGDGEPKDVTGMQVDEVVQLIRGPKGTKVKLTVKRSDGVVKDIPIIRDVIVFEETFAKSLILDGTTPNEKIGYINLPSFYSDYENETGHNCSEDVAKEIEKLKAENVSGIILDLRNNGGGYLHEVVNMSGLFIEKGPIVQVKSRGLRTEIKEDEDPRVQYNGPLVVMVNNYSASASEILAAAMQDYGRAIIVGSKSTFGKGTVQRFVDLDRLIVGHEEIKPMGEVKLTIQKYYRVDGGSVQLKGVTPDITLPDIYQFVEVGEKDYEYPLAWTEIEKLDYQQDVFKINNIDKIKTNSQKRIADNQIFQKIVDHAKVLEQQRSQTNYPLSLEKYTSLAESRDAQSKAFNELFKNSVNTGVVNTPMDVAVLNADETAKARNEEFIKTVSKDMHVYETIRIMHDLIRMNN